MESSALLLSCDEETDESRPPTGDDPNCPGFDLTRGQVPLEVSIKCSLQKADRIMQLLLNHGALLSKVEYCGMGALGLACAVRNSSAVRLLLDYGADVNAVGCDGQTYLMQACFSRSGDADIARMLLDRGANVNARNRFGKTVLH